MLEQAVCFPATRPSLVGVFTKAEGATHHTPAIVLLNAGLVPRTGPNRLYVRLARESARLGLSSFRFDLSGVGDSPPRTDGLPLRDAALRDVQEAFDFLSSSMGVRSFILIGLCSGADLAFRVSVLDKRVVGVVLIDGLPYRTVRSRANDQIRRVRRGLANGGWRRLLSPSGPVLRNLARLTARQGTAADGRAAHLNGRDVPPLAEADAGLRGMVAHGVKIMVVYTEGRGYNYRRQFAHLFPRIPADAVLVEYFEGADHTFNLLANQERLVATVNRWTSRFLQRSPQYVSNEALVPASSARSVQ
jgi:dienelactone hydrolase